MAQHKPKYQKKPSGIGWKLPVLLLAVVALAVTGVSAKYLQERTAEGLLTAPEFYFTSDYLTEEGAEYHLNTTAESVTFVLKNSADTLRSSEDAIAYVVTTDKGSFNAQADVKMLQGTIAPGEEVQITLYGLVDNESYKVTATGEWGLRKVLSATFTVGQGDMGAYMHVDKGNSAYVLVTVWTKDCSGQVALTIPAGLIPDDTDPDLTGINNFSGGSYQGGTYTVGSLGTYSSDTYRFFKDSAYGSGEITVTVNGNTALEKIPE